MTCNFIDCSRIVKYIILILMNVMRYTVLFLCNIIVLNNALVNFIHRTLQSKYHGENFPDKYLEPEVTHSNVTDLKKYLRKLELVVDHFNKSPNSTDCNILITTSYAKVILARTLKDYKNHIVKQDYDKILEVMRKCANIVSHFIYNNRKYGWQDYEFRVSEIFINDEPQFYSIGPFNKGRFNKWLQSNYSLHEYSDKMDDITLPKEKFVEIIVRPEGFHVARSDSDYCLSNIAYTPEPISLANMQPCRPEPFCFKVLHASPSIAYTLSHRLLNVIFRHQIRRCYLISPEEDANHMDLLCAYMYREAVYLARRGFFARDLFMEHMALCALLGYEEFHRRHWFNKASSWIDGQGCVQENPNYRYNMTNYMIKYKAASMNEVNRMRKELMRRLIDDCHHHPMALAAMVMAHGVRYAAYRESISNLDKN